MSYASPSSLPSLVDLEDLQRLKQPTLKSLPLAVELVVFEEGQFLSHATIQKAMTDIGSLYPRGIEVLFSILRPLMPPSAHYQDLWGPLR